MLNRFKFPTCPGFISFTQPDGIEVPLQSLNTSKNAPYLNTSKAGVAVLTQLSEDEADNNQKGFKDDNISDDDSLDSKKIVVIPSLKEKATLKDRGTAASLACCGMLCLHKGQQGV